MGSGLDRDGMVWDHGMGSYLIRGMGLVADQGATYQGAAYRSNQRFENPCSDPIMYTCIYRYRFGIGSVSVFAN